MMQSIDHIGIAVQDLESSVVLYRDILGLKFLGYEDLPDRGLKIAVFIVKDVRIELLQSTSEDSAVGKFIDHRGEGLHHIAFKVDDAQAALKTLADKGIKLIDREPRSGSDNTMVAFLHPTSTFKVLIELCERK